MAHNRSLRVSLLIPCLVDQFLPEIGHAVVSLFRRLGIDFTYDQDQTCCGQPIVNAGEFSLAANIARRNILLFEKADYIVAPSGSCISTLKEQYPRILADDISWRERAVHMAEKAFELTDFLTTVLNIEDAGSTFRSKACLHECCSIKRKLGITKPPMVLLNKVRGLELVPLNNADACCGFGGEFAGAYPELSESILHDKADNFKKSGADCVILGEPGCLLNIRGYFTRNEINGRVVHIAQVLASREEIA